MWAWGPVTNPTARALASWLCVLWGRHEGARRGRLLPVCVASGVGRSPIPDRPCFGACGRGPLPTGCGCQGVWAWGPVTNPTARALASWLCALSGQHEGARRGRLLPVCGASGVGRSPNPDRPSFRACGRGPLPTGRGSGGCWRGDPSPSPQRALLRAGFAICGGGTRASGRGSPLAWVWGVRSWALSHTRPPVLWGVLASWLCVLCGRHEGARGGGPLVSVWGVWGWVLSQPRPPVLWGVRPGPTTHWLWVKGVWAWGPVTNPTARALASWLCALWWRHEGARGEGSSCLCVGRPGSGALPPPAARPLRRAGGIHYPLSVGAGVRAWGPFTNPTAGALGSWLCALWGGHEGARGGRLLPGCVASGVGRSPTPDRPSFGACGRGPSPTGCGCGGCGRGDPSPTPQRALLRAGFARCGDGTRAPGGGAPLVRVCSVRGRALSHPRPPVFWGVRAGSTTHWMWVPGLPAWGPVTNSTARALASWLCALWGRHEGAWVWGVWGRALSHPRPPV